MTDPIITSIAAPKPDLHLRADRDGLRIYDGAERIAGPWGYDERAEAFDTLEAAVRSVAIAAGETD